MKTTLAIPVGKPGALAVFLLKPGGSLNKGMWHVKNKREALFSSRNSSLGETKEQQKEIISELLEHDAINPLELNFSDGSKDNISGGMIDFSPLQITAEEGVIRIVAAIHTMGIDYSFSSHKEGVYVSDCYVINIIEKGDVMYEGELLDVKVRFHGALGIIGERHRIIEGLRAQIKEHEEQIGILKKEIETHLEVYQGVKI